MSNPQNYGLFVPTTNVWDPNELYDVDVSSEAFKELLVRLYQNISNMAVATNAKDSALYNDSEFVTGGQFFVDPNASATDNLILRPVFRMVVNFGALPNTATKSVAHNIAPTPSFSFTRIYGCATDPIAKSYIPLPYASPILANNIELNADANNVNITTGSNRTAYTITYVILEYIKT